MSGRVHHCWVMNHPDAVKCKCDNIYCIDGKSTSVDYASETKEISLNHFSYLGIGIFEKKIICDLCKNGRFRKVR